MKTQLVKTVRKCCWVVAIVGGALACQDDEAGGNLSPEQKKVQAENAAQDNSAILSASQEVMDITADALLEKGVSGGRTAATAGKKGGPNHNCKPSISGSFDIDRSHKDSLIYSGTITIDYGDGSSCEDSTRMRKGKIMDSFVYIITYHDSIMFSTSQTITFDGFYKDSVKLDGTYMSKSSSDGMSTLDIQNAKVTYDDGTFVTWSGLITTMHDDGDDQWSWNDDTKIVTGALSGTTRAGESFTTNITTGVLYDYSCFEKHWVVPVSGTIDVTVGGNTSVINYGDGTCDKTYTITVNGETTEYTFDKKSGHHS